LVLKIRSRKLRTKDYEKLPYLVRKIHNVKLRT